MRSTAAEEGRATRVALARRMTRRARGTGQTVGLRSLLAKTLRDARLSITLALGLLGTLVVAGGLTMATTYGTAAARADLARLSAAMPAELRGLYGDPIEVQTLGGFVGWHYGAYFALIAGLWSILALSRTIAAEAADGSLELVAVAPLGRRRIALEKIAGHLIAVATVATGLGLLAWATGIVYARFPGDEVAPAAAAGFAAGVAVRGLVAGAVAFALAPLVGSGAAAGLAGAAMLGGYIVEGYRGIVPAFEPLAGLTWFTWTADHVPLVGRTDWGGVAGTAAVAALLLALGVAGFERLEIGVAHRSRLPHLPWIPAGTGGPLRRAIAELAPTAGWWGLGIGLYGLAMVVAARSLIDLIAEAPTMTAIFRSVLPGVDLTTSTGYLQLAFLDFGFLLVGLAAAHAVSGRWGDERSGRLETLLAAPLGRARWTVTAGLATWAAISVVVAILAGSIAFGLALLGEDPGAAVAGTLVLAAYGGAVAGIGMATGGLLGPGVAGWIAGGFVLATFLDDLLAPLLKAPDWVEELALTDHLGRPMTGSWDLVGLAVCGLVALGGLALGARALARRDVSG